VDDIMDTISISGLGSDFSIPW